MKTPPFNALRGLRFACVCAAIVFALATTHASDDPTLAAVRAADDARLAATTAADAERLDAILSDQLHYGHSNGRSDTKASLTKSLTSGAVRYEAFAHQTRTFTVVAPDIVLMRGRVLADVSTKAGAKMNLDLSYLAVWRNENGTWRFLAWQSCKTPPEDAAKN